MMMKKMSQSAVVPEQVCLQQPCELRVSHCRSLEGNEFHRRGAAVVKHRSPKVCERRTTHRCVGRAESASADVRDELTVRRQCQIRRCIAG